MDNLTRYKKLFVEARDIARNKPLSQEDRHEIRMLLDEMDSIYMKLGYRETEILKTWCASESAKSWENE